jgi:nucleoside-triphosphatase
LNETKVYLLTGAVHSGKTTKLENWINTIQNSAGILSPVIENIRYLNLYPARNLIKMESNSDSNDIIICGRYKFLKSAFEKANKYILKLDLSKYKWIFVDEIGKIELNGEGLYSSAKHLTENQNQFEYKLIFIVRDYLIEKVKEEFKIETSKEIKGMEFIL